MKAKSGGLTSKEKSFCVFYADCGSWSDAAVKAGYSENIGVKLIMRKDIQNEISDILKLRAKNLRELSGMGYRKLAFGSVNDALKLMFSENPAGLDLQNLDLFNVSEIKRPKENALEIKFFDRLKALEKLESIQENSESRISGFYKALINNDKSNNSDFEKDDCRFGVFNDDD